MMTMSVAEKVRDLTVRVKNGTITREEAERLAITALQEVVEEQPKEEEEEEVKEEKEEKPPVAPEKSIVDPKTRILSLLTQFEESIQSNFKKMEERITQIVKETEGAAMPLGDYSIGNDLVGDSTAAKIVVEVADKPAQLVITYTAKKEWTIDGVNVPVQADVGTKKEKEAACHLPLRQELLALCTDVTESTNNELTWKRSKKLPLETLTRIESIAKATGDAKITDIIKNKPSDAMAESWHKWALVGQVYLLGSDWGGSKTFADIKDLV